MISYAKENGNVNHSIIIMENLALNCHFVFSNSFKKQNFFANFFCSEGNQNYLSIYLINNFDSLPARFIFFCFVLMNEIQMGEFCIMNQTMIILAESVIPHRWYSNKTRAYIAILFYFTDHCIGMNYLRHWQFLQNISEY